MLHPHTQYMASPLPDLSSNSSLAVDLRFTRQLRRLRRQAAEVKHESLYHRQAGHQLIVV
eukprot:6008631-Amphidinium_carterae.2